MTEEASASRPSARPLRWGVLLLLWTLVGVFFATKNVVSSRLRGSPVPFDRAVLFEMIYWYVWALLTPVVLRLAAWRPLLRPIRKRNVVFHLASSMAIAPLQVAIEGGLSLLIAWLVLGVPAAEILRRIPIIRAGILLGSFNGFVTYWAIIAFHHSLHYYQSYVERERTAAQLESALRQAELQALKSQLHPHFLFNSLHAIGVLMTEDVNAAGRLLIRLSDLLRMTLEFVPAQEITLAQEMDFVRKYLEIEETRFHDRLQVRMAMPAELSSALVPSFVLQPLVENAIKHGVAARSSSGVIEVTAATDGRELRLDVRDDGPGIADSASRTGVGVRNIEARLEKLYGSAANLTLRSAPKGGAHATIRMPLRMGEADARIDRR